MVKHDMPFLAHFIVKKIPKIVEKGEKIQLYIFKVRGFT